MKNLITILFLILIPFSSFAQTTPKNDKEESAMKPEKNDDGEWELTVIDTQFDYFLNAVAKPISQYSESFLKAETQCSLQNGILITLQENTEML